MAELRQHSWTARALNCTTELNSAQKGLSALVGAFIEYKEARTVDLPITVETLRDYATMCVMLPSGIGKSVFTEAMFSKEADSVFPTRNLSNSMLREGYILTRDSVVWVDTDDKVIRVPEIMRAVMNNINSLLGVFPTILITGQVQNGLARY